MKIKKQCKILKRLQYLADDEIQTKYHTKSSWISYSVGVTDTLQAVYDMEFTIDDPLHCSNVDTYLQQLWIEHCKKIDEMYKEE